MFRSNRSQFALCLNSSFFGFFAHAGFLDGLSEMGLRPTRIAGASAGALTGAMYAAGYPTQEILQIIRKPELAALFREGASGVGRMLATVLNRNGHTGALAGKRALSMLREYFGDRRIEDLEKPRLSLSVANLSRSRSQVITHGPLAPYVLASCAVPGMFRAQEIDGQYYWDGGVADPIPFEQWLGQRECRRIVIHLVVNPEDIQERRNPHPSFYKGLGRCHQIISDELFRLKLELAERQGHEVIVLRTLAPRPGPGKLQIGERCIELGRNTVRQHRDLLIR